MYFLFFFFIFVFHIKFFRSHIWTLICVKLVRIEWFEFLVANANRHSCTHDFFVVVAVDFSICCPDLRLLLLHIMWYVPIDCNFVQCTMCKTYFVRAKRCAKQINKNRINQQLVGKIVLGSIFHVTMGLAVVSFSFTFRVLLKFNRMKKKKSTIMTTTN